MGIDKRRLGLHAKATETFRMVPDRLWLDKTLQPIDIKLWCCLCFLARERGECSPTDATLAEKMEASQQTVRRCLHRLEAAQFIGRAMDGRTRIISLRPEGDRQPLPEYSLRVSAG
jgi:DNA-binding MarR family transcriptional regulator